MLAVVNTAVGGMLIGETGPGAALRLNRILITNVSDEIALLTFRSVHTVNDDTAITALFSLIAQPRDTREFEIETEIGINLGIDVVAGSIAQGQMGGGLNTYVIATFEVT